MDRKSGRACLKADLGFLSCSFPLQECTETVLLTSCCWRRTNAVNSTPNFLLEFVLSLLLFVFGNYHCLACRIFLLHAFEVKGG